MEHGTVAVVIDVDERCFEVEPLLGREWVVHLDATPAVEDLREVIRDVGEGAAHQRKAPLREQMRGKLALPRSVAPSHGTDVVIDQILGWRSDLIDEPLTHERCARASPPTQRLDRSSRECTEDRQLVFQVTK